MHDAITIGIPVIAILFWILFNGGDVRRLEDRMDARFVKTESDLRDLRSEMNSRFNAVDARLISIDAQLHFFHSSTGNLVGRILALEGR